VFLVTFGVAVVFLGVSEVSDESDGASVTGIHVREGVRAVGVGVREISSSDPEFEADSESPSRLLVMV